MAFDAMEFEHFFNAVFRSLQNDGFQNPGRTALNAGSLGIPGNLGLLNLRAIQFAISYLVNEQELPASFEARASNLQTVADAWALLDDVKRQSAGRIYKA